MRFLGLLLVLLVSSIGFGQKSKSLIITKVCDNFFVYTTAKTFNDTPKVSIPANGMYVVADSSIILIDTPFDTTQFKPLLDSIYHKHQMHVSVCIATHSHNDRTVGLEFYRNLGIKTFTTKKTDEISRKNGEKRADYLIQSDTNFNFGNYSFQTYYPGVGHTSDNIVLWFPNQKILYGGCFIKSTDAVDLGNLNDADPKSWRMSAIALRKKFPHPRYIIPGHYGWQNTNSLNHTIKLINKWLKKNK